MLRKFDLHSECGMVGAGAPTQHRDAGTTTENRASGSTSRRWQLSPAWRKAKGVGGERGKEGDFLRGCSRPISHLRGAGGGKNEATGSNPHGVPILISAKRGQLMSPID